MTFRRLYQARFDSSYNFDSMYSHTSTHPGSLYRSKSNQSVLFLMSHIQRTHHSRSSNSPTCRNHQTKLACLLLYILTYSIYSLMLRYLHRCLDSRGNCRKSGLGHVLDMAFNCYYMCSLSKAKIALHSRQNLE